MRFALAALVVLALPAVAAAQSTLSSPLPVISSPLAPIGLPLPSPGPGGRDPWIMGPHRDPWITTRVPEPVSPPSFDDRRRHHRSEASPVFVYVPQYVTVVQTVQAPPPPSVTVNVITAPAPEPARPAAPPAPEAAAASRPSTFYLIPGCYMGNIPPAQMQLPPDCDLSRLITRTTQ